MIAAILRKLKTLRANREGGVAVTFAMMLVPLTLAAGAAVDYSYAAKIKSALDAYADAAVLSAVNQSAMALKASAVQKSAKDYFNAQAATLLRDTIKSVKVTVKDSNNSRTAVLTYTAQVPTAFMGVVGWKNINVNGSTTAASAAPTYIDFYLLLDNSPSMGVGATPADVAKLVANTPDQCAFACHDLSTVPNDYYTLAKNLGVTTRIDVVRSATQSLMDTANGTQTAPNQYRMAIYTFGSTAATAGLTNIHSLSSDLNSAKTDASKIDLMTVPNQNYNNDQDTDFDGALTSLNSAITAPGDGMSASQPQKILFFVSDGVADSYYPTTCSKPLTSGRCQEPLTVANCTTLKNRGIKIAVLYTTYLQLPTNDWYMTWVDPFNPGPYGPSPNSEIAKNMQSCATPGFYFEVSPTQGISAAMNALFQKVVQSARLTN